MYIYIYFKLKQVDLKTVQFFVFKIEDYSSHKYARTSWDSQKLGISYCDSYHIIFSKFKKTYVIFVSLRK